MQVCTNEHGAVCFGSPVAAVAWRLISNLRLPPLRKRITSLRVCPPVFVLGPSCWVVCVVCVFVCVYDLPERFFILSFCLFVFFLVGGSGGSERADILHLQAGFVWGYGYV